MAGGSRQKRRSPVSGTILPNLRLELELGQRREFLFPPACWQDRVFHSGGFVGRLFLPPRCEYDADRLLYGLEDPRRHIRLMALGRAVNHPDAVRRAAEVVAHPLEAGA